MRKLGVVVGLVVLLGLGAGKAWGEEDGIDEASSGRLARHLVIIYSSNLLACSEPCG